ncbi:nitrite reductase large subunit NirB [Herbiconiux sp. CPCC 203407]|uniref:assimilatory sulfite reductase (ferredoxin) n=1 Tax=Herbiconiux oxytropis TaxID=2970915 RepID=A0AA41XE67_9MICO|nr:nitrite reductase large subunit NirB [Herbiconiux oxytropis]MCS5723450.1 nitrite reductase large subunit NirB [Herbiconiux oxytropis]MCS5726537.1 nitrite reductase large subunit NirB [Herbiconiux oxytropis]
MTSTPSLSRRRVVVVGGGPAAHRLVDSLLARDGGRTVELVVVSEEPHLPYDRVALTRRLDDPADSLVLEPTSHWAESSVVLRRRTRAVSLDTAAKSVTLADGERLPYDQLVLATGSSAPVPAIPGSEHVRVYRTIDDVDALRAEVAALTERLGRAPRAVVAGGGLLGLEAAGGLQRLGAESTVVHSGSWLMSAQLDEGAGQALGRLITAQHITLELGTRPRALTVQHGAVVGVALTNAQKLPADLVVFAIGIAPRDELARDAGLELGPRGGVAVDSGCRSSDPDVFAIGEVASVDGRCVGLVAPANAMAETLADRLLGGAAEFTTVDDATKLKLSGVEVAAFGDAMATGEGALEIVYADPARGLYQKIVVSDDARTLLGGMFVGDASPYSSLRPLVGRTLDAEPAAYLSAAGAEPPAGDGLPDDALICSCNNVTAGTVRSAVRGDGPGDGHAAGCTELGALKTCTRAGTQCGSCVPLVKKILETELEKSGVSVSRALCEHFPLSRQELFDSVRVLELSSFDEIVARFGTGRGCDICKPVVASVLASQRGEYVLDAGRGTLQDTNDRALANMQKDGTYSVVPRIPGGEITPEKLGVIARVATDYKLYTKITGGQRIDLFGARLEQLPEIWKQLVDAGFESGQAYGKSLRTVKSCVGSTWCRFGVQDSVGMAVQLELRYRGLRAPHKFKLGVSGCARECAEARSKDVGVIATDKGWNLYVGGNGGFQPAHAQLLASDLDDETLIRYIDRYLMYYIRTADRLQRTARWMDDLDGGLDHVREVVVEDSLGLADELEAAMATHVDGYEDEWAATLADPDRLRRFRSFVNAPDEGDPTLARVEERGQLRPATDAERAAGTALPGGATAGTVLLAGTRIPVGRPTDQPSAFRPEETA